MPQTWAYLPNQEHKKYSQRAEQLNMSEGELTQKLILLFLNVDNAETFEGSCLNCKFYQLATSQLFKAFQATVNFFTVVQPTPHNPIPVRASIEKLKQASP